MVDQNEQTRENIFFIRLAAAAQAYRERQQASADGVWWQWNNLRIQSARDLVDRIIEEIEEARPVGVVGKARIADALMQLTVLIEALTHEARSCPQGIGQGANKTAREQKLKRQQNSIVFMDKPMKLHGVPPTLPAVQRPPRWFTLLDR